MRPWVARRRRARRSRRKSESFVVDTLIRRLKREFLVVRVQSALSGEMLDLWRQSTDLHGYGVILHRTKTVQKVMDLINMALPRTHADGAAYHLQVFHEGVLVQSNTCLGAFMADQHGGAEVEGGVVTFGYLIH